MFEKLITAVIIFLILTGVCLIGIVIAFSIKILVLADVIIRLVEQLPILGPITGQ